MLTTPVALNTGLIPEKSFSSRIRCISTDPTIPRQPTKPTVKLLIDCNPFLQLFIAMSTNNNAVNSYKKQGVYHYFNDLLTTIRYRYYNFGLLLAANALQVLPYKL